MKAICWFIVLACVPLAHAGIRASFWLSRCAWEATDVVELAVAPGEARFRVVATLKGSTPPGAIKTLPELAPAAGDRSLLKDLVFGFLDTCSYEIAPPIRDVDRLIVFLLPGDKPANWIMLTSAIWLQDGVAYVFEQISPGPTHLDALSSGNVRIVNGKATWEFSPNPDESWWRSEIRRLLQLREIFDHAVANPNTRVRATELASLVTSGDGFVIRGTLDKLSGEGPEAAHALRPFLDDDGLLDAHSQILDSMAGTGARDIRLDSVIRRETTYWKQSCHQTLDENWDRDYGQPPALHYMRLVSALKTIRKLGILLDLPAVREFRIVMNRCEHLREKHELVELTATLLGQ
jgi:hypothetical protein